MLVTEGGKVEDLIQCFLAGGGGGGSTTALVEEGIC